MIGRSGERGSGRSVLAALDDDDDDDDDDDIICPSWRLTCLLMITFQDVNNYLGESNNWLYFSNVGYNLAGSCVADVGHMMNLMWDTELFWYSSSASHQIWFYVWDNWLANLRFYVYETSPDNWSSYSFIKPSNYCTVNKCCFTFRTIFGKFYTWNEECTTSQRTNYHDITVHNSYQELVELLL